MVKSTCIICGVETFRLVFHEPLCPNGDPMGTGVVILRDRMYAAKEEYWKLQDETGRLNTSTLGRSHGIPYPDSVARVANLGKRRAEAFDKYQKAMKR
jgi:hypothetical protein